MVSLRITAQDEQTKNNHEHDKCLHTYMKKCDLFNHFILGYLIVH